MNKETKTTKTYDPNRWIWHFCKIRGCGFKVHGEQPYCPEHEEEGSK